MGPTDRQFQPELAAPPPQWRPQASRKSRKTGHRLYLWIGISVTTLAIIGGGALWLHAFPAKPNTGLPAAVVAKISNFQPYYLQPGTHTDFVLLTNSISYSNGVLEFSMKNLAGNTVTFSEEAVPPNYDPSQIPSDQKFNTEYGQAIVNSSSNGTAGSLFTNKTWIIINAPNPIGQTAMHQLVAALVPLAQ